MTSSSGAEICRADVSLGMDGYEACGLAMPCRVHSAALSTGPVSGAGSSGEPLDTAAMRADMDEPMSVLGYRRRLQDALNEIADQRMVIASHRDVLHLRKEQINAAEARLAAVEALCAENCQRCPMPSGAMCSWCKVRAAARGEADRG